MKSIQAALLVLLFCGQSEAVTEYGNVTGSLGVIKAFQALRDGNINGLVEALNHRPSPVNESIAVKTSQGEIKVRLIHVAGLTKSERMLRIIIAADARISAIDSKGRNAAHYLSFAVPEISSLFSFNSHDGWSSAHMLSILKDAGLAIDAIDNFGKKPIHYAAEVGSISTLQFLLRHGVPIDVLDGEGKSPIQIAVDNLQYSAVEYLRSKGATTRIYFSDYVASAKNLTVGFIWDHPIGVTTAVASALAIKFFYPIIYACWHFDALFREEFIDL